ncbi:MAG: repressor LexA [Clostridiales bacterium]|nr:repressor LexA [Clostridiales bacterium]
MRTKDTMLMENILAEIDRYYFVYGRAPSTRELAEKVSMSHNTVARYLRDMNIRGMLEYSEGRIVTQKMTKSRLDSVSVPLLGSISCGVPLTAEENVESYLRLPTEIIGQGEFFFLRANGDSMIEAGIDDGDLVLIRKTTEANDGDIVVALVDNENTLKGIHFDNEHHRLILHPENSEMQDIIVKECVIQGVAVKIIKDI